MTGENPHDRGEPEKGSAEASTESAWGNSTVMGKGAAACPHCCMNMIDSVSNIRPMPTNTKISRTSSKQSQQLWQATANLLIWPYSVADWAVLSSWMTMALFVLALSG